MSTLAGFVNNEKGPLVVPSVGGEILPSYVRTIINHYKDPYSKTSTSSKVRHVFLFFCAAQFVA